MKKGFLKRVQTMVAPAALAVAVVAFSPAVALGANHGGQRGGFNGGHSFSAPAHGNFSGNHVTSGRAYGGGRVYNGGRVSGGYAYNGGRAFYGRPGYYRPGFGFGVGVYVGPGYGYAVPAYGYAPAYAPPAACNPAGFYDQAGNWQYYQGCVPPQPPPNGGQGYNAGPPPNDQNYNAGPAPNDPNYNAGPGPDAPPQQ